MVESRRWASRVLSGVFSALLYIGKCSLKMLRGERAGELGREVELLSRVQSPVSPWPERERDTRELISSRI